MALAVIPGSRLDDLAQEIRREVALAEQHWRDAVGHGIRVGQLLVEVKAELRHGEWLPWLAANFPGTARTATRYMQLARESDTVSDFVTLRSAIAALSVPRKVAPTEHMQRMRALWAEWQRIDAIVARGRGRGSVRPTTIDAVVVNGVDDDDAVRHAGIQYVAVGRRERARQLLAWMGIEIESGQEPDALERLARTIREDD
jgi:hypothetical protein